MEYHCTTCASAHNGRFFKAPDADDLARLDEAEKYLHALSPDHTPTQQIPPGDETARPHRWGYQTYRQLFNPRQIFSLNTLISAIAAVPDATIRYALLTVFSDTLRYQNMLCRYDTYALKIIDIFSVHGFPVSLIQCENSVLGIPGIGSGGFRHFIEEYDKAEVWSTIDSTQAKLRCAKDTMQQIYPLDLVDKLATQVLSELTEVDLLANFRTKEEPAWTRFRSAARGHAQVADGYQCQDFYFSYARSPD